MMMVQAIWCPPHMQMTLLHGPGIVIFDRQDVAVVGSSMNRITARTKIWLLKI